jgi:hypothetical protein
MTKLSIFKLLEFSMQEDGTPEVNLHLLKRKLLAEFELSHAVAIDTSIGLLTRNDVISLVDTFTQIADYHLYQLVARDAVLTIFLKSGQLTGRFVNHSKYQDVDFLRFITPHFIEAYNMMLISVLDNELEINEYMATMPLLVDGDIEAASFEPVLSHISHLVAKIAALKDK